MTLRIQKFPALEAARALLGLLIVTSLLSPTRTDASSLFLASPGPGPSVTETAAEPRYRELPNFHDVDEHVYRGGQPGAGGIARLKGLGIRTIIDLRYESALLKAEEAEASASGIRFFSVPMYGLTRPTDDQVSRVLGLMNDPGNWPVFVHCLRGSDRTGAVVACYRISQCGWNAERAIREALDHGMYGIEFAKRTYIRDFYAKSLHAGGGVLKPAAIPGACSVSRQWSAPR